MAEAVIVDYVRTPFSRSRPGKPERDAYNHLRMDEAMSRIVRELVDRTGINPEEVNDMLIGCAMEMKEQYLMGGRTIMMLSDFPVSVPCQGMDRVCISGMSAIHQGAMEIMLGYSDMVIAGGMEHMTHVPMDPRFNPDLLSVNPRFYKDERLRKYDLATAMSMGLTAEKLFKEADFTREEMDEWSMISHHRAAKGYDEGYFTDELLPMEVTDEETGETTVVDRDQSVRPDTNMEALAGLQPVFNPEGEITAGNSSPLNAGAAVLLLMSAEKAESLGLKPMAKIISMGWAGVEPSVMGKGPVPASRMALEKAGMKVDDIDLWEINEAFAIVTIYCARELGVDLDKVNVKGGAIAIGHPLAASGPRLTGTLARILGLEGAKYGMATLCGGGGQGGAVLMESV